MSPTRSRWTSTTTRTSTSSASPWQHSATSAQQVCACQQAPAPSSHAASTALGQLLQEMLPAALLIPQLVGHAAGLHGLSLERLALPVMPVSLQRWRGTWPLMLSGCWRAPTLTSARRQPSAPSGQQQAAAGNRQQLHAAAMSGSWQLAAGRLCSRASSSSGHNPGKLLAGCCT